MGFRFLSHPVPRAAFLPVLLTVAALPLITGCMSSPPGRENALRAVARWEDRRAAPPDSLRMMLTHRDAHVRLAAARAAGLIGRPEAVAPLLEVLRDPSVTVRGAALFSLGLLGGERAVAALDTAARDPRPVVRLAALRGLAQAAGGGPALLRATLTAEGKEAAAAWDGLRNRAGDVEHGALVAAIDTSLARTPPRVRWRILRCAEAVPDSSLIPALAGEVRARDVQVRVHALRALAKQHGPAALDAVLEAAADRNRFHGRERGRVDIALCRALGSLGGEVLAAHHDDDTGVAAQVADLLITAAGDRDPHVAETALAAMAACVQDLSLPPEAAVRESLLPPWRIRMYRAAAGLLESPHPGVRREAVGAWAGLRGAGCATELARLADTDQPVIAAAALAAIARIHPDPVPLLMGPATGAAVHPVADARDQARRSPRVRMAALEGLTTVLTDRPHALPAGLPPDRLRRSVQEAFCAAALDDDFPVAATGARLLAGFPDSAAIDCLDRAWLKASGEGAAEIRRGIIAAVAAMPADTLAALAPAARARAAEILQRGFDSPDLRLRLEARAAAVSSGLLPDDLIPSEASLRLTLPALRRDPRQPPVTLPFDAPRVRCLTDKGEFVIALDGRLAPNTCAVFLDLIDKGFYDGLTFHRVVPDFVVQGGDPRGDGWGGPGYTIRSEWSPTPYTRGTVGIAHDGKDTGGSQFFITLSEQPHLVGHYTVFGRVVKGMDVVDRLEIGDRFRLETIP